MRVNGLRVSAKDIGDKMSLVKTAPFKVHLFRRDELVEKQLTPLQQPKGKAKLKVADKATDAQKSLNASWLGVAWPKEESAAKKP